MKEKNHIFLKIILIIGIIALCIGIYFIRVNNYIEKKEEIKQSEQTEQLEKQIEMDRQLYTLKNYPKVDASLATQPLATALIKDFTKQEVKEEDLNYSNTHPAYIKLINDEVAA